jgi:hypothetical protein
VQDSLDALIMQGLELKIYINDAAIIGWERHIK